MLQGEIEVQRLLTCYFTVIQLQVKAEEEGVSTSKSGPDDRTIALEPSENAPFLPGHKPTRKRNFLLNSIKSLKTTLLN